MTKPIRIAPNDILYIDSRKWDPQHTVVNIRYYGKVCSCGRTSRTGVKI